MLKRAKEPSEDLTNQAPSVYFQVSYFFCSSYLKGWQFMGWTNPVIIILFAVSVIIFGVFIWHELKQDDPLLELRLYKNKNFLVMKSIVVLIFLNFSGINYLLPFYLEYVPGYETSTAELVLTTLSFSMIIAGIRAGSYITSQEEDYFT